MHGGAREGQGAESIETTIPQEHPASSDGLHCRWLSDCSPQIHLDWQQLAEIKCSKEVGSTIMVKKLNGQKGLSRSRQKSLIGIRNCNRDCWDQELEKQNF